MFKLIKRLVLLLIVVAAVTAFLGWRNTGTPETNRRAVLAQYETLRELLLSGDARVEAVSGWSVRDHVEHLLLANEGIVATVVAGREPDPVEPKTLLGRFVLAAGYIPRGQGQAPDGTVPDGKSVTELVARCVAAEVALGALDGDDLAGDGGVVGNHPVFGGFTAADWLRLMVVHDQHHLKIIDEIKAADATGS